MFFILYYPLTQKSFNSDKTFTNVQRNVMSISVNKPVDDLMRFKSCPLFARMAVQKFKIAVLYLTGKKQRWIIKGCRKTTAAWMQMMETRIQNSISKTV